MKKLKPSQKSIFEFSDYREYLNERFLSLKKKNKNISLEYVAKKTGISKSYVRFIFNSKRHIILDIVPKLARALKLERTEQLALTYMVCRDTCQEEEIKRFFDRIFLSYKDVGILDSITERLDDDLNRSLFQSSLSMVIHSLAKQKHFQPDVSWIKGVLRSKAVSDKEIQLSLETLIKNKSLVRDSTGRWKPEAFVLNGPGANLLDNFKVYRVGMKAMDQVTEEPSSFSPATFQMLCLSFDSHHVQDVHTIIMKCRDELIALSQTSKDPTYVQFINLNTACLASSDRDPAQS